MSALRVTGIVAAFTAAAALAAPAHASGLLPARGTGEIESTVITSTRVVGSITIADFVNTGTVTGTLAGTFVETGKLFVRPSGDFVVSARAEITGTAGRCGAGVVKASLAGVGTGGFDPANATGTALVVSSGRDAVGFQSVFVVDQVGTSFTYSGTYRCRRG
jgi:hypothetical protein